MKQIFKSSSNSNIDFIVREANHIVDKYDVFKGKIEHINSWKFFISYLHDLSQQKFKLDSELFWIW
jgi:hypothetical protein